MQGSQVGLLVSRALQLIFAIVVLGVSISFYRDIHQAQRVCDFYNQPCRFGRLPSSSIFAAFTGAWGVLDALVGLAGAFVTALPWIAVIALDGLAAVFYLAAGINLAVLRSNLYVGSGCGQFCTKWTTSIAFNFLALIVTLIIIPLIFLARRGRSRSSHV